MKKQQLKEKGSYYYEEKGWYESCPDILPVISPITIEILPRSMYHREILKEYNITPYSSYAEAAAVLVSLIPDLKYPSRLVYFTENEVLYRFRAWRGDGGQLDVDVFEVDLDDECGAGRGVCFSNGLSDTLETLGSLDSLELSHSQKVEEAIKLCKKSGFEVFKKM